MDELARRLRHAVAEFSRKNTEGMAVGPEGAVQEPIRTLIVDDETDFLDSLRRIFARRNIDTYIADSGPKALEVLREQLVDVVVLEVKMPGMDGLEVLRRIKQRYPSIQVYPNSVHDALSAAAKITTANIL